MAHLEIIEDGQETYEALVPDPDDVQCKCGDGWIDKYEVGCEICGEKLCPNCRATIAGFDFKLCLDCLFMAVDALEKLPLLIQAARHRDDVTPEYQLGVVRGILAGVKNEST